MSGEKHSIEISGWVEIDGRKISPPELGEILRNNPCEVSKFAGEFYIKWEECQARDIYGVFYADLPPGVIVCNGKEKGKIKLNSSLLSLEMAICKAVELRADEGIVALSGGVDSTLIASLARIQCVCVGLKGSHDLKRAKIAADTLSLSCDYVELSPQKIHEAFFSIIDLLPVVNPVEAAIASTQYCIAEWAQQHGYKRIICGQGADELFAGYSRYLTSNDLETELKKDFKGLVLQAERDQRTVALHNTYLSMPYLDYRVVCAADSIPADEKIRSGVRKVPLRKVAEHYIPPEIAWYEKKAMQYGTGVIKVLRKLARDKGYNTSLKDYVHKLRTESHDR